MNTSRPEAGKTAHYSLTPAYVSIRVWDLSERSFNQFLAFLSINLMRSSPAQNWDWHMQKFISSIVSEITEGVELISCVLF